MMTHHHDDLEIESDDEDDVKDAAKKFKIVACQANAASWTQETAWNQNYTPRMDGAQAFKSS